MTWDMRWFMEHGSPQFQSSGTTGEQPSTSSTGNSPYSLSGTGTTPDATPGDAAQLAQDLAAVYGQDVLLTQLREMAQMEGRRRALYQERQAAAARLLAEAGRQSATPEERGKAGLEAAQITAQSEALLWEADDIRRRAGLVVQRASGGWSQPAREASLQVTPDGVCGPDR